MSEVFDLAIIGAGPGGYTAAIRASQLGARVVVVESLQLGGVCLNWGCIPTKTIIENLKTVKKAREIAAPGIENTVTLERLFQRKDTVINNLRKGLETLFKTHKISLVSGSAQVQDANTIVVQDNKSPDKRLFEAKNIIIATGSRPVVLPVLKTDGRYIINSDQIFNLAKLPVSVLIVGGGAIGCEFAQIFLDLGVQVHLVELTSQILPEADEEIAKLLAVGMSRNGIKIYTGVSVSDVSKEQDGITVTFSNKEKITVDLVVTVVGRQANIDNLGLEQAGIAVERGRIKVNQRLETTVKNIYAIGDCVNGPMLAHKASYDAVIAVENIIGREKQEADYTALPKCIFSAPEIGMVGQREQEAKSAGAVKIGKFPFAALGKAQAAGDTRGFVKIVAQAETGKIIGGHIIGPQATELINQVALAMANKMTTKQFAQAVFAHPTMSEAVKEAMDDVDGLAISIGKKR
ncbi:MAG: dihydrolipoyl dehydrogenase [bacterium]|nr:dihydrolipoyl dehydrogenase [bacterium]MDD5353709.1 dihydrolipoyl dehydrogenase [bacterium]MDD5755677.1 dihydrolipoyl dehydrogenase [bacterium]